MTSSESTGETTGANPNRAYPEIDRRIRDTYAQRQAPLANLHKQYDMYKRFIRWASDRLADDGIIGFITNRARIWTHAKMTDSGI